jgi:hypothetical protein
MEDGSPIGDPFEEKDEYEIPRVVEVDRTESSPAPEYHLRPEAPGDGDPHVAFISHNKADKTFARQLGVFLSRNGVEVWFDEWDLFAGDPIIDSIEQGLDRSNVFILVVSPASLESNWVREEIRAALMNKIQRGAIRIIPLMKERVDRLPPFIEGLKYINFANAAERSASPWDQLLRAVFRRSDRPAVLKPPRFVANDDRNERDKPA